MQCWLPGVSGTDASARNRFRAPKIDCRIVPSPALRAAKGAAAGENGFGSPGRQPKRSASPCTFDPAPFSPPDYLNLRLTAETGGVGLVFVVGLPEEFLQLGLRLVFGLLIHTGSFFCYPAAPVKTQPSSMFRECPGGRLHNGFARPSGEGGSYRGCDTCAIEPRHAEKDVFTMVAMDSTGSRRMNKGIIMICKTGRVSL